MKRDNPRSYKSIIHTNPSTLSFYLLKA